MTTTDAASRESKPDAATMVMDRRHVLLVTGMAGAGRSTALKCLEDIGYEAVDNLPLDLLPVLLAGLGQAAMPDMAKPLAFGIDSRTTGFSSDSFASLVHQLRGDPAFRVNLLFLDCEDDVLQRRFTETRRRHPLAQDRPVVDGIHRERILMGAVRDEADLLIDTTDTAIGDLKSLLIGHFGPGAQADLALTIVSFSYRHGLPREADLVFDVRFLDNPHYNQELRPLTGEHDAVGKAIASDPAFPGFFAALTSLLWPLLPGFEAEGKSYLTIAVGCTGGRHRSVFVAGKLAAWLSEKGRTVTLRHRDLSRDVARTTADATR
ncbi:MAG: RNase adapter RapZ [Rhodospirillaceae bacterium]|nr:RNase adapter RapZ [Rhodospirillaceae bacterium]